MRGVGRHVVIHHLAGAEIVEIGFGVVVSDQLVDGDDVERAIPEGEAGRHVEALEDGLDLFLAAIVLDGVDVAEAERADEQRALVAPGHLPRRQHVGGVDFDLEARRQLDLLHHRREFGVGRAGRRPRRRRQALLGFGLVAEEPVVRRMGPEFLGAGLVFLQWLLLCAGLAGPRDKGNCRERKNRSIESRFHRVTPYAAGRLRMLLFWTFRETKFGSEVEQTAKSLSHRQRERSASRAVLSDKNNLRKNFFWPIVLGNFLTYGHTRKCVAQIAQRTDAVIGGRSIAASPSASRGRHSCDRAGHTARECRSRRR